MLPCSLNCLCCGFTRVQFAQLLCHSTSIHLSGWVQALRQAATANGKRLTTFSPAVLRKALRQAGNVVAPCGVPEVLQYVISDRNYEDLDKLHLVLLCDGSVQQLRYGPPPSGNQPKEKQFFYVAQPQIQRAV